MSDYGTKTSIIGQDVKTADGKNLSHTSKLISPKMEDNNWGTYAHTFTSNPPVGTTVIKDINHGYSYIPAGIVYAKYPFSGSYRYAMLPIRVGAGAVQYFVDGTKLRIQISRADATDDLTGETWTFKYYIFVEDGD